MTQRVVNYTYGTGNPVLPDGSIDVRDGIDNLQSFDIFMNADEDTYNQRDGEVVKTRAGAVRAVGIQRVGDFTTGCTVTERNQGVLYETDGTVYVWLGALPKVVPPASSPATTGGVGPTGWLDIGDASLRSLLASTSGADNVTASSGLSVQDELDDLTFKASSLSGQVSKALLSRIKVRKQAGISPWTQAGPNNILADSMGYGYFASYEGGVATDGGMFYNRWVSIFARMMSAELGTGHYLTCNPNTYEYGGDVDVAKQTDISGTWTLKNTGDYTSNLLVGAARCTSNIGDYLEFTIPATFKECWVHYVIQPGGGQIDLSQNGGAPTAILSDGPVFTYGVARITLVSNNQGYTVLRFAKGGSGSGEVGLSAISPTPGVRENNNPPGFGQQEGGGVNVFAAAGRRLQDVSEKVIQDSCNGAASLIMALGFNDNPLNGSWQEAGRVAFTQRIDWLIQYCNQYDTPLVVLDCSWKNIATSFTRTELKRLADSANGVYVPLPDMVKSGTFPDDSYRISSGLWYDAAHPSKAGHKWIAEALAKVMGLSCSSKVDAILNHDYWISLPLTTTYKNTAVNIARNLAAYKVSGGFIQIRTQISLTAGGNIPSGVANICGTAVNSMFWIAPPIKFSSYYLTKLHDVSESDGTVRGYSAFTGSGVAKGVLRLIRPAAVVNASFNGASSFEIDRIEAYDNI